VGFNPAGSTFFDRGLFGRGRDLRDSGGSGRGNPDSFRPVLSPDPPRLSLLAWLVLGWLGLVVPLAMVLALAVLVAMALVVLEVASLISVSSARYRRQRLPLSRPSMRSVSNGTVERKLCF
jgi:hypothetical protein